MKKLMQTLSHLAMALVVQGFFLASPAFANMAETGRVELRQEALAAKATFKGTLSCQISGTNDGNPCSLRFKEQASGRIYELNNAGTARKLYNDGAKEVAIVGVVENGSTINIAKVSKN